MPLGHPIGHFFGIPEKLQGHLGHRANAAHGRGFDFDVGIVAESETRPCGDRGAQGSSQEGGVPRFCRSAEGHPDFDGDN